MVKNNVINKAALKNCKLTNYSSTGYDAERSRRSGGYFAVFSHL
jgi:hypothetical protein